jgi:hypothetical protein
VTSNNENEALPYEEVARRAYEIYQDRGSEPGLDLDDWFQAEQDLRMIRLRIADETTEQPENTMSRAAGENS